MKPQSWHRAFASLRREKGLCRLDGGVLGQEVNPGPVPPRVEEKLSRRAVTGVLNAASISGK